MTSYSSESNSDGLTSTGLDHVYIQSLSIDLADLKQVYEATAIVEQERSQKVYYKFLYCMMLLGLPLEFALSMCDHREKKFDVLYV
jgi:hypothetical protein